MEDDAHKEVATIHPVYVGYLGFAGQIPWAMILVHLPMLEPVVGGKIFSFAVGIAMGVACNIVRFAVLMYGRSFTFNSRVVVGSIMSAIFTFGYFVLYLSQIEAGSLGVSSPGFWLGLGLALFGGAGNAQLLSTGYGIASMVASDNPVANNLFFLGQAAASTSCWPLKHLMTTITSNHGVHLGVIMGLMSLVSLSAIPVFFKRISTKLTVPNQQKITCADCARIMRQTMFPSIVLWLSFMFTNLVTPGQVMRWGLPSTVSSASDIVTNEKLYLSLCLYVNLLADALGRCMCVLLASNRDRFSKIIASRYISLLLVAMVLIRASLVPLFYAPPSTDWGRFILLCFFGLIHGVAVSLALSLGSARVAKSDSDLAGYLSSFTIINGLLMGSIGGIVIRVIT